MKSLQQPPPSPLLQKDGGTPRLDDKEGLGEVD